MTDDPQGSFVKFGDGVILVEAMVAQFRVSLDCGDSRSVLDGGAVTLAEHVAGCSEGLESCRP